MVTVRTFARAALPLGLAVTAACLPGERPTAIHLMCDDAGCRCEVGFADCDHDPGTGCELPVSSDRNNCGACGVQCHSACIDGACSVDSCEAGFEDCSDDPGCETETDVEAEHCGACDHSCLGGGCNHGTCEPFELLDRGFFALTMAADASHFYFCEGISGTILRAPHQGGEIESLAYDQSCGYLDYDYERGLLLATGDYVYWSTGTWSSGYDYRESLSAVSLGDGSSRIIDPQEGIGTACCSATVTAGCPEDATIEACVCGTNGDCCTTEWDSLCVSDVTDLGCGTCRPEITMRALAAGDDVLLIQADASGQAIIYAQPAGGGAASELVTYNQAVDGIALSGDYVYWVEARNPAKDGDPDSAITRMPVSGGETEYFVFGIGIANLSASGDGIFWTENKDEQYQIKRKTGELPPQVIYASLRPLTLVQPDETHVYWAEVVNDIPIGIYSAAIDSGELTTLTNAHYVYTATSSATLVAWADYSDRIFGVAK